MSASPALIAIVGPTAIGKSALADNLAKLLNSCVISADSMQIYKGMDIGTSKVPLNDRSVPYYFLDIVEPGQAYSAALYQAEARKVIDEYLASSKVPVICGGTGLYIRAALDDFIFPAGNQIHNPVRERYMSLLNSNGSDALYNLLQEKDPQSAELIHPNNSRRVIRALEMLEEGQSYAEQNKGFSQFKEFYSSCLIGLRCNRELLYQRIESRVNLMFAQGLVEEVISLRGLGYENGLTAQQAIGYKEIINVLDGEISIEEAKELIKQSTRRYAKRQITWFKKDPRIIWIDIDVNGHPRDFSDIFDELIEILQSQGIAL